MQEPTAQTEFTLAELYETYETGLRRFACNLSRDPDWAEDLTAETILKAMAHLTTLSQLKPFQRKAWLWQVLKNLFLDQVRRHKREERLLEQVGRMAQEDVWVENMPTMRVNLPAQHRRVLEMRYELGMTSVEIGQELGLPPATVRSRLRLAIQWIKNHQE